MAHPETCPTCGQSWKSLLGAEELFRALSQKVEPQREVYRAARGGWYVTYGEGETTREAVDQLLAEGKIRRTYNNCADAFWTGRTIDMERSKFAGKNPHTVYVGDADGTP